jgi:hypothetical protein
MATQAALNERRNHILAALSSSDLAILQPHLEPVPLGFRERLQSANRQVSWAAAQVLRCDNRPKARELISWSRWPRLG